MIQEELQKYCLFDVRAVDAEVQVWPLSMTWPMGRSFLAAVDQCTLSSTVREAGTSP